ncbi:PLDc N-terminal domain-containing protein, partial [Singulisphaera rosea]
MSDYLPHDHYWLLPPLLTTLGFGLALILLAHLLRSQRSPSSTIAWLLVILLIPYVGVPLYLTFGGRKMRQRARRKEPVYRNRRPPPAHTLGGTTERILQTHGVSPPTTGNRIRVVTSGEDAYRELIALIDRANETIYITTYILGPDEVGTAIVAR